MDNNNVLVHAEQIFHDYVGAYLDIESLQLLTVDERCDRYARSIAFWYAYKDSFDLDMMQKVQLYSVVDNLVKLAVKRELPDDTIVDKLNYYRPLFTERMRNRT